MPLPCAAHRRSWLTLRCLVRPRPASYAASYQRDQCRRDEARDLLAPVYRWFTEDFDTLDLKEAKALLDELALMSRPLRRFEVHGCFDGSIFVMTSCPLIRSASNFTLSPGFTAFSKFESGVEKTIVLPCSRSSFGTLCGPIDLDYLPGDQRRLSKSELRAEAEHHDKQERANCPHGILLL